QYDPSHYFGWVKRTQESSEAFEDRFPWLGRLCGHAEKLIAPLLEAAPTVIHGEYDRSNILVRHRHVIPVDWESCAIGPGEIDLAALTEGCRDAALLRQCEEEYLRVHWPSGEPAEFERTLRAARVYLHFRWLGERRDAAARPETL